MAKDIGFVYVDNQDVSSYKNEHLNDSSIIPGHDISYKDTIAFLGSSGEIAAHGNIYGSDIYVGPLADAPSYAKLIIDTSDESNILVYTKQEVNSLLSAKENVSNKISTITNNPTDNQYPSAKAVLGLIKHIDKDVYDDYVGIDETHEDYNKIICINDGSGIIVKGILYINNPYWIKIVTEEPVNKEPNTVYMITE